MLLAVLLGAGLVRAEGPVLPAFSTGETLKYKLSWPSGINLGEAILSVTPAQNELRFELTLEAELPTRNLVYSFTSTATRDTLCSLQFHRKSTEGSRMSEESLEFDQKAHQAKRTRGGQTTTIPTPDCARDPLTFFYYLRNQIAAGTPVNAGSFFIGPGYTLDLRRTSQETVRAGGRERRAEKYMVTYRAPSSTRPFDVWISADPRREPVLFQVQFPLAVFSAELQ